MTKKTPPINGEQPGAATEPMVTTEAQDTAELFEAWLAAKKGPVETASYNEATRHLASAWEPELQSALKNDVYDADELKGKIEASILKLTSKTDTDPDPSKRLENHVLAILRAWRFEQFKALRSETPADNATTTKEIEKLGRRLAGLAKDLESMHKTSRELVEENLPAHQIKILKRAAEIVAVALRDLIPRLADVPFCEQTRKNNTPAESVTRTAAIIFERRTGELPARIVDRVSGEAGGPFVEWLTEIFSLLKIEVSADWEARKYLEWISMETTANK